MKHDIEVIIVIWDTLSPVYDLGETVINGKVFRGIAEEIGKYIITHDLSDKVIMEKKSTKESLKLSESYISDNNSEISNQNDSFIRKTNMANKSYKKKKNCC